MSRVHLVGQHGLRLLAAAALCGACAGSPPQSLVDARTAYQRASKSEARELAPAQLHAAQTVLNLAEKTYDAEGDSANAEDRAYVAMRKAQLAEVHAQIIRANQELAEIQRRSDAAEQDRYAAMAEQLESTREELENQARMLQTQSDRLTEEAQKRQDAEAAQARALAELENVKQDARGTVITLSGSVVFASGASELMPAARSRLSEVATALTASGANSNVVIEGHTDSKGSDELNRELSLQRAASVRDYLVSQGVDSSRIEIRGYGPSRPVADNSTPSGRANNRRVEIVVQSGEQRRAEQPTDQEIQPVGGSDEEDPGTEQETTEPEPPVELHPDMMPQEPQGPEEPEPPAPPDDMP